MKIKLDGKHTLCSDEYCYWITVDAVSEKGRPYERRVSGYMPTFPEAVVSYINKAVNSSESDTLCQLKDEMDSLVEEVMMWNPEWKD